MQLAALALALYPDDERSGLWSRDELEQMYAAFVAALERAFELGLESRASAAAQVRVCASLRPRFVAPPCPDGLLRSAESALAFVMRR